MKTIKAHFKVFESECRRLQKLWGLGEGWELRILHYDKLDSDSISGEWVNIGMRRVTVVLATESEVRNCARHEMVHAILEPLAYFADARCVPKTELESAHHEVVNRLLRVLPK